MITISSNTAWILGGVAFLIFAVLSILLLNRQDRISSLRSSLLRLKRSFDELDEQAKLIVKTDLELNKAQEELDKRLNSLDALQKTSRLISTTLDENAIYHRLEQALMMELNFEKNLILLLTPNGSYKIKIHLGYTDEDVQYILTNLEKDINLTSSLREGHSFSSINAPKQRRESIFRLFDVEHFVLAPILTQKGIIGVLFVGNRSNASALTEGDEEMIAILANQIGQSLENARLFEEVFRSSQVLESKVQDRTKQLESALRDVQEISKTKSEFISAVSHELRTPLTSIKGYASILMAGKLGEIPAAVKQRLEKINIHSDNLVKLINDLLDISRIESGRIEMNIGRTQLPQMIENVFDLLTPQMKDKSINWKADVDISIPELLLDSSQVERVFINLVGNAIKFTPEQGLITVSAKLNSDMIEVTVSDTGIGINEDDCRKLFDEFYRVENQINAHVKGSGLGLSLAKKIVEAHDGTIWVTSKPNEGTSFHFTLPVRIPEQVNTPKSTST